MAGSRRCADASTAILCALLASGCAFSVNVPTEEWPGTYVASYPFGTSTLVIIKDYSFSQTVVVGKERVQLAGKWWAEGNEIHFDKLILVADGFGEMEKDWRQQVWPVSTSVERIWWQVQLFSGGTYPYEKQ